MNGGPREHDWAHPRIAPFAAGLLDDTQLARFERHTEGCAECREDLAALRAIGSDRGHHLPDRMISRWKERKDSLRGLQRELIRRHLETCDECRGVLQALGHEPVLDRIAALEATPELMELLNTGMPREERRMIERPRPYWTRREFWMGSVAGGLVAAAAVVIVVSPALRPGSAPLLPSGPVGGLPGHGPATTGPTSAPSTSPQNRASSIPLAIEFSSPTVNATLHGMVRGVESRTQISITRDTRKLELSAEPPDVPDGSLVEVRLVKEGGAVLFRDNRPVEEFYGKRRLVIRSTDPIESGVYRLIIGGTGSDTLEVATYRFEIVRVGGHR